MQLLVLDKPHSRLNKGFCQKLTQNLNKMPVSKLLGN